MRVTIKAGFALAFALLLAGCGQSEEAANPADPAWAEYDGAFLKACKADATGDREAIMVGLCGCTLTKIKSAYSLKFVEQGKLTKDIVQNLSGECAMSLKLVGGRFPDMAREELVSSCTAEAGALGDKAEAYCDCSVRKLEEEFSYDHVAHGLVSTSDYQAIGAACIAEVGAGAKGESGAQE